MITTRRIPPMLCATLLAACTAATQPPHPTVPPTAEPTTSASPTAPVAPSPSDADTFVRSPDNAPTAAVRTPVRAPSEPAPETLIGMRGGAVDGLLGAPNLVRKDGLAEIRLYRDKAKGCTFHIFMYATEGTDRDSTVDHFEARDSQGRLSGDGVAACYRSLVRLAAAS